jgi:hypothetical protein
VLVRGEGLAGHLAAVGVTEDREKGRHGLARLSRRAGFDELLSATSSVSSSASSRLKLRQLARGGQGGDHVAALQCPLEDRVWTALRGRSCSSRARSGAVSLVVDGRRHLCGSWFLDKSAQRGEHRVAVAG